MKVVKWILIIIVAIPLLVITGAYIRNKAIGPTGWALENTTKELRNRMRDPESMIIRSSFIIEKTDKDGDTEIYVCGIVDGRNGFGGYAGGTRFVSKSLHSERLKVFDTHSVELDKPEDILAAKRVGRISAFEEVYWNSSCVDSTHPPIQFDASAP